MKRRLLITFTGVVLAAGFAPVAGSAAPRHAASFTPAPHRKPAPLVNHSWTPKPLRIVTFVPTSYPSAKILRAFPEAIAQSHWLKAFEKAYNIPASPAPIGEGFLVDPATLPTLTSTSTVNDLMTFLDQHVDADGIKQDARYQTIFILYLPCTPPQALDGFGCLSHHPAVPVKDGDTRYTALDSFATVEFAPSAGIDSRNRATGVATHELIEAATHTNGIGWYLKADDPTKPWRSASPIVEDEGSGTIEAADYLSGSRWFEKYQPAGFAQPIRYEYVRAYSPYGNAHRNDPGVPLSPHPYYNVSSARSWYGAARGAVTTIKVHGWSSRPVGAHGTWVVDAGFTGWLDSSSRNGAAAKPNSCTLVKTHWSTKNGGQFDLSIKMERNAPKNTYCVVQLKSSISPVPPDGDSYHPWYIGFTPALA